VQLEEVDNMGLEIADGVMIGFIVAVVTGIVVIVRHCKNTSYRDED
jgi:hypothetical protein